VILSALTRLSTPRRILPRGRGSSVSLRVKLQLARVLLTGPAAQRSQAAHIVLMWLKGVDLRGVSTGHLGLDEQRSSQYVDSGGADLDAVFRTFEISPKDALLDIGCGKGGTLITLSRYPFAHVDGLEISPYLVQIARRNLIRLQINKARVFCSCAEDFRDLDDYTYLYMYHPFLEPVMKHVLEHVCASFRRRPRRLTLVYKNPVCDTLVVGAGFSPLKDFSHSTDLFRVYSNS
jgi:SAM-dependent methyltransferase